MRLGTSANVSLPRTANSNKKSATPVDLFQKIKKEQERGGKEKNWELEGGKGELVLINTHGIE